MSQMSCDGRYSDQVIGYKIWGSFSGEAGDFSVLQKCPDYLGPTHPLVSGHRDPFPGVQRPGRAT